MLLLQMGALNYHNLWLHFWLKLMNKMHRLHSSIGMCRPGFWHLSCRLNRWKKIWAVGTYAKVFSDSCQNNAQLPYCNAV